MKNRRQQTLLHVVQTRDVGSQEELQSILRGRGFDVNVATISRDLRELGIVKIASRTAAGRSAFKYVLQQRGNATASVLHRAVNEFVQSIVTADNFFVVKTRPRCALLVGSEIDKARWPEVVGTVTGDDAIIAICQSQHAAAKAVNRLRSMKAAAPAAD